MRYNTNFTEARRAALRSTSGESLAILEQFPELMAIDAPNGYIGEYLFRDKDFTGPICCAAREAQALGLLAKLTGGPVLEIGSAMGWSTAHIAQYAPVIALDPFIQTATGNLAHTDGGMLYRFIQNMERTGMSFEMLRVPGEEPDVLAPARVQLIVDYSPGAFNTWSQLRGPFGMVFVDGHHHDGQPLRDVQAALPFVKDRGIIVLHDMWLPDVKDAAHTLEEAGWEQFPLHTPCYLSVFAKEKPTWWKTFQKGFAKII